MTIQSLIKELVYPGEQYILQHRGTIQPALGQLPQEDALGSVKHEWIDVKELIGVIQRGSHDPQITRGQEERADYYGFFEPNFEIPDDELFEYRIKHIFPAMEKGNLPFIRYFRFQSIDRNLRLNNQMNHYEMTLELTKQNTVM
jgi:hypothetical protein